jgi:hypothetical protein
MTDEYLKSFDSVIVGISPITSLSANRVYGALHVIDRLWDHKSLTLFVDAPKVNQITASLKSTMMNKESFTKNFFSYRKDYKKVISDQQTSDRLFATVEKLFLGEWPTTLYPSLPWSDESAIYELLPIGARKLVGMNFDSFLFVDVEMPTSRRSKWAVDTYKSKWTTKTLNTLAQPHTPMKWNKGWTDEQVLDQINRSIGAIIAPADREGSWWTYRIAQALSAYVPVVTDWKHSSKLGPEWDILAGAVEDMTDELRYVLAVTQRQSYMAAIPTKQKAISDIETALNL